VGALLPGATALLVASLPSLHLYTTSGLETVAMSAALVAATAGVATLERTPLRRPALAIALLVAATLRPEGMVLAFVALAAWSIWGGEADAGPLAVLVGVTLGVLLMVRRAYYGAWAPTTFHVSRRRSSGWSWRAIQPPWRPWCARGAPTCGVDSTRSAGSSWCRSRLWRCARAAGPRWPRRPVSRVSRSRR
jgi:hypothetical protein